MAAYGTDLMAEKVGFDLFGASKQHFAVSRSDRVLAGDADDVSATLCNEPRRRYLVVIETEAAASGS